MKEKGKIVSIRGNLAKLFIKVESGKECETCPLSKLCYVSGQGRELKAINDIGANIGDEVEIETSIKRVNWVIFFLFIMPIIMLLSGTILGKKLMGTDSFGIFLGFIIMGLYFVVLSLIDRYLTLRGRIIPRITKIVTKAKGD